MTTDTISAALRRLELSDGEQVVYLSLLRTGRATARMLADRTGLTRPSVYDQLKKLLALSLVVELDIEGKAHFAAGDIKHLDALLLDKIEYSDSSGNVHMTQMIYANKVACISSNKEAFGFIVESQEFAALERLKFT